MRNTIASTMMLLLSVILININVSISLLMFTIADIIIYIILVVTLGVSSFILTTLQDSVILPLIEVILPSLATIMMKTTIQGNIVEEPIAPMLPDILEVPGIDNVYQFPVVTTLLMPILTLLIGSILGIVYKLIIAKLKGRELEENLISIIVNYKYIKTNRVHPPSLNTVLISIAWFMLILFVLVKLNLNSIALLILYGLPVSIITILFALLLLPVNLIVVSLMLLTAWFSPIILTAYIIDTIIPVIDIIKYERGIGNGITLGSIKAILSKARGFELSDVKILKERTILASEDKWKWIRVHGTYKYNPYKLLNPHIFITGTSGSGKSFTTALLLSKLHRKYNVSFIIIDYHGEYFGKIQEIGMVNPQVVDASSNTLNILELDNQPPTLRANELADIIKNIFNLGHLQRIELQKVIEEAYADAGITDDEKTWSVKPSAQHLISAYNRLLSNTDNEQELRVLKSLKPYIQLLTNEILSRTTLDINEVFIRPTILDLSKITSEFIKRIYVSLLLLKIYYNLPYLKPNRLVYIVIDEAHRIITENEMVLSRLFAESRKYNIGLIIVSQNPKDIPNNIIANTSLQIVLRVVEPSNTEYAAKILGGYSMDERIDTIKRALYYLPKYHGIVKDSLIREPLIVDLTWNNKGVKNGGRRTNNA